MGGEEERLEEGRERVKESREVETDDDNGGLWRKAGDHSRRNPCLCQWEGLLSTLAPI